MKDENEIEIRKIPYPFSCITSFASDCDSQSTEHAFYIHKFLNEKLGLPISNSIWIQSEGQLSTSLFNGIKNLETEDLSFINETKYGLILKYWHRGYFDHIHSWHGDNRYLIKSEINLINENELIIEEISREELKVKYEFIRLYFRKFINGIWDIEIQDSDNKKINSKGIAKLGEENKGYVEFIFPRSSTEINTGLLTKIKIKNCPGKVEYLFLERSFQ